MVSEKSEKRFIVGRLQTKNLEPYPKPWILPRDGGLIPSSVTIYPHGGMVYAADLESVL